MMILFSNGDNDDNSDGMLLLLLLLLLMMMMMMTMMMMMMMMCLSEGEAEAQWLMEAGYGFIVNKFTSKSATLSITALSVQSADFL
jgi:flagellar basal body-associated protein FliL